MKRDNLSIEGLRVILFLCIFLFHAWGMKFPLGWAGINTFLVITAYFMTRKWLQKPQNEVQIRESLWKRALRLYPSYLVVIIVMTALFVIIKRQLPGDFFSYILFAQNYQQAFVSGVTQVPGVGHFWYLTLDFYLALIWLVVFKYIPRKYLKLAFIALLLISVAYRSIGAIVFSNYALTYTMPWGMMDTFAAGGLLAFITVEGKKTRLPLYALVLGVIGFVLCVYATTIRYNTNVLSALTYYQSASGYADNPFTVQIHLVMVLISFFLVWFCVTERRHKGFY